MSFFTSTRMSANVMGLPWLSIVSSKHRCNRPKPRDMVDLLARLRVHYVHLTGYIQRFLPQHPQQGPCGSSPDHSTGGFHSHLGCSVLGAMGFPWKSTRDHGMRNAISHPSGGSVVLRGVEVAFDSDIGIGFISDCCRHIESIISAEQLRKKYGLDDAAWRGLATNEELQFAIERQRERRTRSGESVREKAQHVFLGAPDILDGRMRNDATSPRFRVDAIREIRPVASVGPENSPAASAGQFVIKIDLSVGGTKDDVIVISQPLKAVEHKDK